MGFKIFLDDIRKAPAGYQVCRTIRDCEMMLSILRPIDVLSIDYDLGGGRTTMELLEHIAEKGYQISHINIHSDHRDGVPLLWKYCEEHFPDTNVTTNKA